MSIVDVSSIPLYLVAGPSLDVCVHSEATQQWIVDCILPNYDDNGQPGQSAESWSICGGEQLERGILLKVEDSVMKGPTAPHTMTELLLYATVTVTPFDNDTLPTPPLSSSPGPTGEPISDTYITNTAHSETSWKIYASPLSSKLAFQAAEITLPRVENLSEARFLEPPVEETAVDQKPLSKRKSISSLFDDAAHQSKRLKRRGGEGIAKAMATLDPSTTVPQSIEQTKPTNFLQDTFKPASSARAGLSRASSTMSTQSFESSRPSSRRDSLLHCKRSSLHRVESISSLVESSHLLEYDDGIEQQNKSALTRIVMAGMRVHGLQQRKPLIRAHTTSGTRHERLEAQDSTQVFKAEGTYKSVYHQTFKAASFTFRMHMALILIEQEAMRDVVDRLLAIFCADPLQANHCGSIANDKTEASRLKANPFDLPSAGAHMASIPRD